MRPVMDMQPISPSAGAEEVGLIPASVAWGTRWTAIAWKVSSPRQTKKVKPIKGRVGVIFRFVQEPGTGESFGSC